MALIKANETEFKVNNSLFENRRVVILTHKNPDGDGVASAMALKVFLELYGCTVSFVVPGTIPTNLQPLAPDYIPFIHGKESQGVKEMKDAEIIYCVDFNSPCRLYEGQRELFTRQKAVKIALDHHPGNTLNADHVFSYPDYAASAQIVLHFILANDYKGQMNRQIAEFIAFGIISDTNGFHHNLDAPELFTMIIHLQEYGVNMNALMATHANSYNESRLRIMGHALNRMIYLPECRVALLSLDAQELKDLGYTHGDTEGLVNLPLSMRDCLLSVFVSEREHGVSISVRSKGELSAALFAQSYFDGGGHRNAAGADSTMSVKDTVQYILQKVPLFFDENIKKFVE